MAGEVIGWGGEFKIGNAAATPVLTEIANITSITLPSDEVDDVEVTHLKSPDRRREYIGGLIDGGEMVVEGNYVPGGASDLVMSAILGLTRAFECTVPTTVGTSKKWVFSGTVVVKTYDKGEIVADEAPKFMLTLRLSGAVTQAAGT
jgi:hypothetical protein